MQQLNDAMLWLDSFIGSAAWFPYALLGTGLFFTIYLKFPQVRYFGFAIKILKGKYDKADAEGDTSHFQALATALSGTVGTGNIAGVALAIHLGGPAALFWMIMTAAVGMCTKFVEVTLSHKYREKTADGTMAGGPMYYMKNKMNLGWLAAIFAAATVFSSFGTGSLPQVNTIASSLKATFDISEYITGGVLAVLLGLVIIGGIKRIAAVTEKLVPSMAVIYFIGAFAVIFYNIENVIPSFISIFSQVFSGSAASGGFLGATLKFALEKGVGRGLFSNEAGQGSAPIAHAAAKGDEPVSEGLVAILEPFIDTIVICTITGLVLLSSGVWNEKIQNDFQITDITILADQYNESDSDDLAKLKGHFGDTPLASYSGDLTVNNGIIENSPSILHARSIAEEVKVYQGSEVYTGTLTVVNGKPKGNIELKGKSLVHSAPLTIEAFKRGFLGDWGQYIVSIGILLFAFSTAISWSYYGDRAMTFLFGAGSVIYFRIVYIIAFFLAAIVDTTIVWTFSALTIALMTIPNLVGILVLHKDMKNTISDFWIKFKQEWPDEKTPE
ncbi:alanine/glycine:cation symporter family protein [Reichenbachiella versicolor]|uniref:alanine/glycine:cation symporter family protein n=1 Tax=Reichenbachiella versicolor TaxID=1821036 RepID=UPI000D6E8062|nr:sodium:alanine symporter family protein [Reichenbachiella versicolor]